MNSFIRHFENVTLDFLILLLLLLCAHSLSLSARTPLSSLKLVNFTATYGNMDKTATCVYNLYVYTTHRHTRIHTTLQRWMNIVIHIESINLSIDPRENVNVCKRVPYIHTHTRTNNAWQYATVVGKLAAFSIHIFQH